MSKARNLSILIITINYGPELIGIGKYSNELSEWLSQNGVKVRVITAPPHYPQWKVFKGYKNFWSKEVVADGNLEIFRSPIWLPRRVTVFTRLISIASFVFSSLPIIMMQIFRRPNIVFLVEPSLALAPSVIFFSFIARTKIWLHIQDFEVDAAFSLRMLNQGFVLNIAQKLESKIMRRFDIVSTISNGMLKKAAEKGMKSESLFLLPNWADSSNSGIQPRNDYLPTKNNFRERFGVNSNQILAMYSGNMGMKQGLEVLGELAHLSHAARLTIKFAFVGEGVYRNSLEKITAGLPNVKFYNFVEAEHLTCLLSAADIHLLPQKMGIQDLVLPSKLANILLSGRPVIAAAASGTEVERIVRGAGIVVQPENAKDFFKALATLEADSLLRENLGSYGRAYALDYLNKEIILRRFERKLKLLTIE
jgi:colanic acid biosynthesis glycosyl transferase WcaI